MSKNRDKKHDFIHATLENESFLELSNKVVKTNQVYPFGNESNFLFVLLSTREIRNCYTQKRRDDKWTETVYTEIKVVNAATIPGVRGRFIQLAVVRTKRYSTRIYLLFTIVIHRSVEIKLNSLAHTIKWRTRPILLYYNVALKIGFNKRVGALFTNTVAI